MKYLNLAWAIRQRGSQFRFALLLGESESWLSRRLTGRVDFSQEERDRVAQALGFPAEWLFQQPTPPASNRTAEFAPAPMLAAAHET
jgi:transcriptional regulator with XRE-family HTH domain